MENQIYAGAVIAAGGMATRMQGVNKQLLELDGVPVLARSIIAMGKVSAIKEIVVTARREMFAEIESWKEKFSLPPFSLVQGGESRQQSVQNGIRQLSGKVDYFVIHDGARPFADEALISRCLRSAVEHGAATAAVKTKDTIKKAAADGSIENTPDRNYLYLTQTPQIFSAPLYRFAAQKAQEEGLDFTDDCQLIEHIGHKVWLAQGDYRNIKITTPEDIAVAKAIQREMLTHENSSYEDISSKTTNEKREGKPMIIRCGHGYDVHKLVEGRKLILGGVDISWEKGLLGHSDADVLTHAIMDALLGAAAMGDIGQHFPDTDPQYAGADSIALLRCVVHKLQKAGYQISNIDSTVIAQKPKLKDYIPKMRERIADACGIEMEQVSVKATTEENLGFTGAGEGISAHSVCVITK